MIYTVFFTYLIFTLALISYMLYDFNKNKVRTKKYLLYMRKVNNKKVRMKNG